MSITRPTLPAPPDEGPPADAVGACLHRLRAVLDEAADASEWSLDDRRVETRLAQALAVRAQVDELVARLVSQVEDRDLGGAAGASSTKAHLVMAYRLSGGAAAGLLAQSRSMTGRTDATRRAWSAGWVSGEQAAVIGSAIDKLSATVPDRTVVRAQLDLVEQAQTLTHTQLQVLANHLVEVVDPDGADAALAEQLQAEEARALQQTTFRGRRGVDGIARYSGKMPNVAYDMLTTALEAIASPRRNPTDPPAAAVVSGATAETDPAQLSYGQRMGRAFVELLEHLPTDALPRHGAGNATVVVTIDSDKLASGVGEATLTTGTAVSASEVRRLACNAGLLPLMLGSDSAVLDLGLSRRLFDRYQRIALAVRDRGCIFPSCDRPPAWTEAHHITGWQDGGRTDMANGCLLCNFHHHLVHRGEWAVVMASDGVPRDRPTDAHRPRPTTPPTSTPATTTRVSAAVATASPFDRRHGDASESTRWTVRSKRGRSSSAGAEPAHLVSTVV